MSHKWNYDREVGWHTLHVEDPDNEVFVFVYKSGGDYVVSAMREGDIGGGEIEYMPNLRAAKLFAEKIAENGSYRDYLQGGGE